MAIKTTTWFHALVLAALLWSGEVRGEGSPCAVVQCEEWQTCVVVDGEVKQVPPASLAIMRALAKRPGMVVSREDLLAVLPGAGDDTHAVETAVARLRAALGAPKVVQTVVKRGYRLALDPVHTHPTEDR